MGNAQLFNQQLIDLVSHSCGDNVYKQRILLTNLVLIIAILACGSLPEIIETTEPLASQSQPTSSAEDQSQPTIRPTGAAQPTEQRGPYFQIQTILRSHPPCDGNNEVRRDAILTLDEYLKNNNARVSPDIIALYENMMGLMEFEINDPVTSGVRIWSMYNHGFIVKTPKLVFAFDLVNGYSQWNYQIPDVILEQIQVLFISHRHRDHRDPSIIRDIERFGGVVVAPSEDEEPIGYGTIYLSPGEELTVAGLHVKAYDGLHGSTPIRIYVVTTAEGLTIMHTGDNQTSASLPDGVTVDIFLLNAWVNESGSTSATVGVRNSINKLTPNLTILGHIQELYHEYEPSGPTGRVPFEWALAVDDVPLPGEVSVQIWGEYCDYPTD